MKFAFSGVILIKNPQNTVCSGSYYNSYYIPITTGCILPGRSTQQHIAHSWGSIPASYHSGCALCPTLTSPRHPSFRFQTQKTQITNYC